MKTSTRAVIACFILLILSPTSLAQFDLGPNGLINAPAPTLRDPGHIGLRSPGFVGKVGGVAFGATATPADRVNFKDLSLSYRPEESDGHRLWVVADGQQYQAPIYDWQLIPVANFADSPYKSCVTLFGELDDKEEADRLRKQGNKIINYHPAFVNTLSGLRLLQLDLLINDFAATELPRHKQTGGYLLGAGESPPVVEANVEGWRDFFRLYDLIVSEPRVSYRSYVINDEGCEVRFDFADGAMRVTGSPLYYFWVSGSDLPGYDYDASYKKITEETIKEATSRADGGSRGRVAERETYVNMLLRQLNEDRSHYDDSELAPGILTLLSMRGDAARRNYLRLYPTNDVRDAAIYLRALMEQNRVIPLREYNDCVSAEILMVRRINPAIWDTGVSVMRYAAFFRYNKAKYPARWKTFLKSLNHTQASPQVQTPTIMQVPGDA